LPGSPRVCSVDEVISLFRQRYRRVVTFLGYGELGYEDPGAFQTIARREIAAFDSQEVVINAATLVTFGFAHGIADIYEIARSQGFRTSGVYPSVSLGSAESHGLSGFVEDIYFIEDQTWGGYLEGSALASPTLTALTSVTDEVVAIGGGEHTAQEIQEFVKCGIPVRYYALEMNRAISSRWHQQRGGELPDYLGRAYRFWSRSFPEAS